MRKRILQPGGAPLSVNEELDVERLATAFLTSEAEDAPIENAFDASRGPGGSRWMAARTGPQTVILEFDAPQALRRLELEIEEREVSRTQELAVAVSRDGGESYRELLRQEFHFSPPGTTFERESWAIELDGVTHLRLEIVPDKGGKPARASLTSLVLR